MTCPFCGYELRPLNSHQYCDNCRTDIFSGETQKELNLEENKMYKEINPTDWTFVNVGDFIEGVLVRTQKDIGVNESMLYSIETPEGVKNVWGAAILDSRMALVKVGDKLKITYQGLAEAKPGKNPAKIFKVEVDQLE